ncbi:MAG: DUF1003 domain-containing protein [Actinobacteria bacterium]|nr:DUF1003 domain-containing protein [Actinomycetota bacterium]
MTCLIARCHQTGAHTSAVDTKTRVQQRTAASHETARRPCQPAVSTQINVPYEPGAFGRFSEAVARNLGTARFLVVQTFLVLVWITINVVSVALRWDPYPFILLNLMFSVQAAYAAPLILLAQNRQEDRDRQALENDRAVAIRTQENAEYLARELAAVRLALEHRDDDRVARGGRFAQRATRPAAGATST